jgi:hypothetical protein
MGCKIKNSHQNQICKQVLEKPFEFKNAIFFCCDKKQSIVLQQRLPKAEMWAIVEIATFTLNPIRLACMMNQSRGH